MTIFSDNPHDRNPELQAERCRCSFFGITGAHHNNRCNTHGNTCGNHVADTVSALPKEIQRIYRKRGNPITYINEKHRARFTLAAKNISKTNYALLSALYLLTADKRLWGCCKHHNHWLNARTGGFYGVSSLPRYCRRCRMAVFLHSPMAGHRVP